MASTSSIFLSSSSLPLTRLIRKMTKTRHFTTTFASKREFNDRNYNGRVVDEDLIVLRKRIHEMKMIERNYEPPADWSDWEKKYYTSYDSYICEVMGFLQSQLMDTRPSIVLGAIALLILSLPISTAAILSNVLEIAKEVLNGMHLN